MSAKMSPPGAEVHKFSSTQVDLPEEIAHHLVAFGKTIPDSDLNPEEGASYGGSSSADGREKEAHVTVKYGIHGVDPEPVAESLAGESPVLLKLGKTALFKSPEQEVLIVEILSPDLHRLNGKIEKSGPFTDTHPGYKPHATIAYLKPGKGKKYEGLQKFEGMEATIPSVTFSGKDGNKTEIPLGGEMPKKMKFEREMARNARKMTPPGLLGPGDYGSLPPSPIPHEVITDAPGPGATSAMAAGGKDVVRGNSNKQPLTPEGHATVARTGAGLARLGGVDQIIGSDSERTRETAHALQGADSKHPPIRTDPGLESNSFGQLEGEPKTPGVKKFLADLIRKSPDYRIPGQGATSSRQGESFNEFRTRALSSVRGVMQALAQNPGQAIAVPKHSQVSKLVHAWIASGLPDDLSVDSKTMIADAATMPGEVERFYPDADGQWKLEKFDPHTATSLPKGSIYFVEHGETPATAAKSGQISAGQKARAKIVTAIREGDWKGALSAARSASSLKQLSDDEISEAIDEALPGAEEADKLQPHQLLSAATAASPGKRAELMPAVQKHFADLSSVSPDGQQALQAHMARLG